MVAITYNIIFWVILYFISGLVGILIFVLGVDRLSGGSQKNIFAKALYEHNTTVFEYMVWYTLLGVFGLIMHIRCLVSLHMRINKKYKRAKKLRAELFELLYVIEHAQLTEQETELIKNRINEIRNELMN